MNRIEDLSKNQILFIKSLYESVSLIKKAVNEFEINNILKKINNNFINVDAPRYHELNGLIKIDHSLKSLMLKLFKIEMNSTYSSFESRKT